MRRTARRFAGRPPRCDGELTEVRATLRWRETDSNFQFLGLGRAFLYRLGVTAPFLASSRNASGTAFVASNRGRPRRRVTLNPRLMTSSCRSALDECAFSCVAAKAEYGVASRFWRIRQAAKPGIGWAVGFLACAGLGWPLVLTTGSHAAMVTVFAIIYALGLTAFLESLLFASKLTWGQKTPEPLARIGSNPAD